MKMLATASKWLLALLLVNRATAEVYENGLEIDTTKPGDCAHKSKSGDTVEVHYKGMLMDGTVFDESYKRGAPFELQLGRGMVIAGWEYGLLDMCLGEERLLIIPPQLGYGARKVGPIPAEATLKFETKLMSVNGEKAKEDPQKPLPDPDKKPQDPQDPQEPDKPQDPDAPAESGQCKLLGPFALFVQAGLGMLALLSLVFKRYRERPRRPVKVWFFDVSKQVVGAVMVHFVNLLMSELPGSAKFDLETQAEAVGTTGQGPNPCSFYLINIAVDTTIGIPILVLLLKVLHKGAELTPLANPPESIKSGHYGQPPHMTWWFKQSVIYFIGLLLMKLAVLAIFTLLPWIAMVGDWALRWTEGNEALQITFVMFVFPLIMNGLQYYIIDSFIKDPAGGNDHEPLPQEDRDSIDDAERPLTEPDAFDEDLVPVARAAGDSDEFKRR